MLGHAAFVRRGECLNGRGVIYEFGHRLPINISALADELCAEFHRSLIAFRDFKLLVGEQCEAIRTNSALP